MMFNNIIIVDDNPTTIFYNIDVVTEVYPGVQIESYEQTNDLLLAFKERLSKVKENMLLLLDVFMPDRLGFEVLTELETQHPTMEQLYVIIVTSSNLKSDVEKATQFSSIIGYIEKPLTIEKLKAAVDGTLA